MGYKRMIEIDTNLTFLYIKGTIIHHVCFCVMLYDNHMAFPLCYSTWNTAITQWSFVYQASISLRWRHNEHDGVSNHHLYHCSLNSLSRRRSQETSKLRVTGLCEGNSPVTGEFPAQTASNAENVSIWWRHHADLIYIHQETRWSLPEEMLPACSSSS